MGRIERQQWMNARWQEMHAVTDAMFRQMQLGSVKGYRREMMQMIMTMQEGLETHPSKTKQVNKPKTCQHCNCWNGTTCTNCRSTKWSLRTGAGCTCDWWEPRQEG